MTLSYVSQPSALYNDGLAGGVAELTELRHPLLATRQIRHRSQQKRVRWPGVELHLQTFARL